MRERRNIKPYVATTYNDAARAINRKELAVYIVRDAYEETKKEIKRDKNKGRFGRVTGKAMMGFGGFGVLAVGAAGAGLAGIPLIVLGAIYYLVGKAGAGKNFKYYKIKDNKAKERIELLRVSGGDEPEPAIDLKYDTILEP